MGYNLIFWSHVWARMACVVIANQISCRFPCRNILSLQLYQNYQKALDDFDEKNPNWGDGVYATDAWWEDPKFLAQVEEAKASYRNGEAPVEEEEEEEEIIKDERTLEIEKIATEWAKREFFLPIHGWHSQRGHGRGRIH